jgi:succinyl-CoA synthetase beta subunit
MNIHEYQAKELLRRYGVPVLAGRMVQSVAEARAAAAEIPGPPWVVKAQIHAGGRGAGHFADDPSGKGGVRVVRSEAELTAAAEAMLGHVLVTKQTGPAGRRVHRLYIEAGAAIAREFYLSLLVDRRSGRLTFVASAEGGMEIEEVAARAPEKIVRVAVDPAAIEINPLVLTADGRLIALDAKLAFEDNALFRHPEFESLRDENEEDPKELEASRHGLNYVALDGTIGCMVNGAGLAMATMDIIKLYGGEPANFLDVGGGATKERVAAAFKIILSDPKVEAVLINIFGGIMRCDVIAEGVVAAAREVALSVPLVVRLEGTNVALGKEILARSGLPIIAADNLADAAEKVVRAAKGEM